MEHHAGTATLRGGNAEYESAGQRHVETQRHRRDPRRADRLSLSIETVTSYIRNLMGKLEMRSSRESVVDARRRGLLPCPVTVPVGESEIPCLRGLFISFRTGHPCRLPR
ncbi:LuxR C-terminal-related transcriptional regulator [Rhodococcus wratislaviensis]|uniref:LuxR C-terminal-related transcriptional regulator n=1 Tax=Rhodococcus wratislaviensis TaxID=44752 RepID=UPI00351939E0